MSCRAVAVIWAFVWLAASPLVTCSPASSLAHTLAAAVGLLYEKFTWPISTTPAPAPQQDIPGRGEDRYLDGVMSSRLQGGGCPVKSQQVQGNLTFSTPLPTRWSDKVDMHAPLPEYPRPQMQRDRWLNLNGVWELDFFGTSVGNGTVPFNCSLPRQIVVPFPVEAPLSGVNEHHDGVSHLLYRRTFTVPTSWQGRRVLLHFGAVEWEASVYVNQRLLGVHRGGFDKFEFDVTDALGDNWGGPHELMVSVFDPTEFAHIAVGKQRLHPPRQPSSIWYTSNSGIWQTVWLEPVPEAHIWRLDLIPDIDMEQLNITVHGSRAAADAPVEVRATTEGRLVATIRGTVGKEFALRISQPHLWSPDDPFLYDIEVLLLKAEAISNELENRRRLRATAQADAVQGDEPAQHADTGTVVDKVVGYFGMRKVSIGKLPGEPHLRVLINNRFLFQMGMLDQGYWPDGIYTAPTDEALVSDIVFAKSLGYNMLRKHIKVEPDRWYYHADRLGMLVWQDMPSMFYEDFAPALPTFVNANPSAEEAAQWESECQRMIQQHLSFPCIVVWTIFNEGWGQFDTVNVVKRMQVLDPSRLFNGASGWNDAEVGHLIDMHKYVGPDSPVPSETRAAVLGEFGGLGWRQEGHLFVPDDAFCYEMMPSLEALEVRYLGLIAAVKKLMLDPERALSAAVYTEITDVEAEVNGWLTYDREFNKVLDPYALPAAHRDLLDASQSLNERA